MVDKGFWNDIHQLNLSIQKNIDELESMHFDYTPSEYVRLGMGSFLEALDQLGIKVNTTEGKMQLVRIDDGKARTVRLNKSDSCQFDRGVDTSTYEIDFNAEYEGDRNSTLLGGSFGSVELFRSSIQSLKNISDDGVYRHSKRSSRLLCAAETDLEETGGRAREFGGVIEEQEYDLIESVRDEQERQLETTGTTNKRKREPKHLGGHNKRRKSSIVTDSALQSDWSMRSEEWAFVPSWAEGHWDLKRAISRASSIDLSICSDDILTNLPPIPTPIFLLEDLPPIPASSLGDLPSLPPSVTVRSQCIAEQTLSEEGKAMAKQDDLNIKLDSTGVTANDEGGMCMGPSSTSEDNAVHYNRLWPWAGQHLFSV